ncbi:aminotransferase class III-fold pyridoxal phosphate-dependent enzyme [Myxococcus stipitatus]|uniref:aminotransferase class III-fold pyridoxal phosphate-dependent enzyme n=1 Tax=Myxococcus stipitatus TaxID=83455 RepID=UPI001F2B523E|nr:aminotransferase class III-fold pyridoxal phosphate-dependent enzyme [Myxococcus stipitatus]MCE9666507.1 aminotransferase class III-fold pyridoxal phosphate-dependent enzyme [Myxococcus stipitatus]
MVDDITALTARHTYGTWRAQRGWSPLHVTRAEGCSFWDATGKRYLDLSSQLVCTNLGHQNPAVIEAIRQQAAKLAFIGPAHTCEVRARAVEKLLEVMPPGLDKFFFTTSGTDANEAALKIARLYTGRHKVIARYSSYHGSTSGSVAATGDLRRWMVEPASTGPGVVFGPEVNCYRCPLGRTRESCGVACADYLAYMMDHEQNVAAVIIEPIVGSNGVLIPPADYLPRLAEHCRKRGVLLIADEVMSGWGRTGKWFSVEHWGVVPDILTTAKGITNAAAPLGVVATSRAIADHFDDHFFAHGHTYEAHPLTLAPAIAAIDEYRRLDLLNRARTMGEVLGARLRALADKHPSIGDVRGMGLFWALDLVRNRGTREPFNVPRDKLERRPLVADAVSAECMKRGVSVMSWVSHLLVAPPLIITEAELDEGVAALDAALEVADRQVAAD